jgi:hypothetical protein
MEAPGTSEKSKIETPGIQKKLSIMATKKNRYESA